jgi:exosome complex component RRP4
MSEFTNGQSNDFSTLVVPGQRITEELGYLRGHGTYMEETDEGNPCLTASVAGEIDRVNKLISVKPVKSR